MKKQTGMVRFLLAGTVLGCAFVAGAKTCRWSGLGGDGMWTNANNWVDGVIPGRYIGSAQTSGEDCDVAVFGAVGEGAATAIDLDGHICVSNLVFESGAPGYVFSGPSGQEFGLCFKGNLTCEEGLVSTQRFDCAAFLGYFDSSLGEKRAAGADNHTTVRNDGTGLIDFNGGWSKKNTNHYVHLYGEGDIRIAEGCWIGSYYVQNYLHGNFISAIKTPLSEGDRFKFFKSMSSGGGVRRILLPAGDDRLSVGDSAKPHLTVEFQANTVIEGPGTFGARNGSADATARGINFRVSPGSTFTALSDIELLVNSKVIHEYVLFSKDGRSEIMGELRGSHREIRIDGSHTLSVPLIGNRGCENSGTSVGTNVSEIVFLSAGTFEYAGEGETTGRAFRMASTDDEVATIRNAGTGALVLTGTLTPTNDTGTLLFDAQSAPITVDGTLSDGFSIAAGISGSHPVTFTQWYPFSGIVFNGGSLVVDAEAESGTATMPPVSVEDGDVSVTVPADVTLTVASVSVASGSVDFIVPEGSVVKIGDKTHSSSVLVNGYPTELAEDGTLVAKVTKWKSAVDGNWSESANWSRDVPQSGIFAEIAASGTSYTVEITASPGSYPDVLKIRNDTDGEVSELLSAVPLAFTNRQVKIENGGRLVAEAGLVITNETSDSGSFTVSSGGELCVTGGTYDCVSVRSRIVYDGGKVVYSGDAQFVSPQSVTFGTGETVFDGNSAYRKNSSGGYLNVQPGAAGETATFTLAAANGTHDFSGPAVVVGGMAGATGVFNSAGNDGAYICSGGTAFGIFVTGFGAGVGILNVSGGTLPSGNNGFHIGSTYRSSATDAVSDDTVNAATGIVHHTGGTLTPSGWGCTTAKFPCGLAVGDASRPIAGASSRVYGEYNLSGGTLSSNQGGTYLGIGFAEGRFVQTGGTMKHRSQIVPKNESLVRYDDPTNRTFRLPFVVGLAGGIGSYVITGGSLEVDEINDVFIGGANPSNLSWCASVPWTDYGYPVDSHDAEGTFAVRGGEVEIGGDVYVGCDGSGELEVGPAGSLYVGGDVVLSNSVSSLLRIVLGPDSVPVFTVAGKVAVSDGAKLVVDASECRSDRICTELLVPEAGFEGMFDAADIEIILPEGEGVRVPKYEVLTERNGETGLWLYQQRGTVISLR